MIFWIDFSGDITGAEAIQITTQVGVREQRDRFIRDNIFFL